MSLFDEKTDGMVSWIDDLLTRSLRPEGRDQATTRSSRADAIKEALSELPSDWNTLPYGDPGNCRANLLIVLDDPASAARVLELGIDMLAGPCAGVNRRVLIWVNLPGSAWKKAWGGVVDRFAELESSGTDLQIRFPEPL